MTDMISFSCLSCNRSFQVKDKLAGKKTKCPKCGQSICIPYLDLAGQGRRLAVRGSMSLRGAAA